MLSIASISVFNTLSTDFLLVKFDITPTQESVNDYTFNIYRSLSPEDTSMFFCIAHNITETQYEDHGVNLMRFDTNYYYKVRANNVNTGESVMSNCYGHLYHTEPDNLAFIMLYENQRLLELINNDPVSVLLKRRLGVRCSNCWDSVRKQARLADCPVCYGTGVVGGYSAAISIRIGYLTPFPGQQMGINTDRVSVEEAPVTAWTTNYPILQPDDVIVDSTHNYRFEIDDMRPIYKNQKMLIRQTFTMHRVPATDVIFTLPV